MTYLDGPMAKLVWAREHLQTLERHFYTLGNLNLYEITSEFDGDVEWPKGVAMKAKSLGFAVTTWRRKEKHLSKQRLTKFGATNDKYCGAQTNNRFMTFPTRCCRSQPLTASKS